MPLSRSRHRSLLAPLLLGSLLLPACAGPRAQGGDDPAGAGLSTSKKPSLAQFKLVAPAGAIMRFPTLTDSKFLINGRMTNVRPMRFDGQTVVRFPGRCRDGYQRGAKLPDDAWPIELTLPDPDDKSRLFYAKGELCFFTRTQTDLDPPFYDLIIPDEKIRELKRGRNTQVLGKDKTGTPLYKFTLRPGA